MLPAPPNSAVHASFLKAFEEWHGRAPTDFPLAAPPCDGVGAVDEDAILAKLFAAVASPAPYFPPTHSMAVLTAAIGVHQRRLDTAWNAARSSAPGVVADRSAWTELRPYEAMIAIMHGWLDALWTRFVGEVA